MQYLVISFIGDRYVKYLKIRSAVSFENVFFIIIPRHILNMRYPFVHMYRRTYKAQFPSKNRHTKAVSLLNNRLNVPLNLKENLTLKYVFS